MDDLDLSCFSLKGRTAIITGGSGGIGRACAIVFAKAGCDVVIASLPPDSVPPVVQEVEALGPRGLGVAVDVTDAGADGGVPRPARQRRSDAPAFAGLRYFRRREGESRNPL